jgi:hypothetical protein
MAKSNISRRNTAKPKIVETPLSELAAATARAEPRDFDVIKEDIHDYLNLVECAWHALNESSVVDGDEAAAKARNGIHLCARKLDQLMEEMEYWKMSADRRRSSKPRQEVAHG